MDCLLVTIVCLDNVFLYSIQLAFNWIKLFSKRAPATTANSKASHYMLLCRIQVKGNP